MQKQKHLVQTQRSQITKNMGEEYQRFIAMFKLLEKEQSIIIGEYQERLVERKIEIEKEKL